MTAETATEPGVHVEEVRVLEGPNLYFSRPAVKVSLTLPGYLDADTAALLALAGGVGLRRGSPGRPGSGQRQRFVMRVVERAVRVQAAAAGTRRLGVRVRPATDPAGVVAAFVWHSRGRAEGLGAAVAPLLQAWLDGSDAEALVEESAERIRTAPAGEGPRLLVPRIPVASVTGTNGKTTTTRLLAHISMTAGNTTAWSSTDGVVVQGEVVEPGDYSGPAGARGVLSAPGVQVGILETARGGMLLKGMGVSHNDVSVVTNVSPDHLGLQGVDTLDQLAEVKAIVTRATRPGGWVVLNGDDPRVWAMRAGIKAKPWAFSLDPTSPALRESLRVGGRGITVLDGYLTVLSPVADPDRLARVVDVPATLSGLSRHNTANVLAAAAAALGLGIDRAAVVEGLRTFQPDAALNPGRMNIYTVAGSDGAFTVVVDLAHNEAGLEALLDVADGLRAPGARVHLGLGAAGDRTEEILQSLGEIAGRRADHVVAAHKERYLRGRTMEELEEQLRTGLARSGVAEMASYPTELSGLRALAAVAAEGDVLAIMCHAERDEIQQWIDQQGGTADDADTIRRKAVAARGEHEFEDGLTALWLDEDAQRRIATARALHEAHPDDARITYEYAGTHDSAGHPDLAVPLYREALAGPLREPYHHRAQVQLASSLRNLGRLEEAVTILTDLADERRDSLGIAAFAALALHDTGRPTEALQRLIGAIARASTDEDVARYRRSLTAYGQGLGS